MGWLAARPGVRLFGPSSTQRGRRVPVVSFTAAGRRSADNTAALQVRYHYVLSTATSTDRGRLASATKPLCHRMLHGCGRSLFPFY